MSDKIYVLDGALLECNMGLCPAKLLVTENHKVKIQGKFKATDADVQVPATFGTCKLKPSSGGYLPCVPALQKWTKTAQKSTLGSSKKFLLDDSQTMCSTGGMVTIKEPMQLSLMGSMNDQFKDIAMMIPGAVMGDDRAPSVVECYWMDEDQYENIDVLQYGEKAAIFVMTQNMDPGQTVKVTVSEKDEKKIDGKKTKLIYSGTVQGDGTARLELLETKEDWNTENN